MSFQDVLDFWFNELEQKQWYVKDQKLDHLIASRFGETHRAAIHCELSEWRANLPGRLAEIIVLDQFSRNMYRDQPAAFANDPMALTLSQEAIQHCDVTSITPIERSFLYVPFMHSESLVIHEQAVKLYTELGIEDNLDYEHRHKAIIEQFGRYPHRNAILGREGTAEELEFLEKPGSRF